MHSLKQNLKATLKPFRRQVYEKKRHPLVSADITDESEYEPEAPPTVKPSITFNAPRVWRGEYKSPIVVNILETISENFPTSSRLISAFHSGGLKVDRKVSPGIFQRQNKSPPKPHTLKLIEEYDEDTSAIDLFSKSIITKHLIGRSTWDRVVGMHSEFAKSFIASKLKDTRLVFVINTAGSGDNTSPIEQMFPSGESPQADVVLPEFEFAADTQNTISSVPIPSSVEVPEHIPSASQPHLILHEPTTPKPSFSPRKKNGVKYNPSILVPLM